MKKHLLLTTIIASLIAANAEAQNTFPSSGRTGIYTTTPASSLQVRGGARIGTLTNYTNIDSATGNLTFAGNSQYRVGGNKYAFAFSGNPNYGLYFNQTNLRYEFRDGSATPVFYIGANDGTGYFLGDALINALTIGKGGGAVSSNTALGNAALIANTSGFFNTATGNFALYKNTIGASNAAHGYASLYSNTTGSNNTAYGYEGLYFNTTGNTNTAIGFAPLFNHKKGDNNVATGSFALFEDTSGVENTATGHFALYLNLSGIGNSAVGAHALESNKTGNYNTTIGYKADVNNFNYTNSTAIGYFATVTASNQVRIGNGSVTSIGGQVGWTTLSDGRVKKNIKSNIPGLAFINKLKPVSYNLDEDAVDRILQRSSLKDKDDKTLQPSQQELAARKQKEQIIYTGFVAQDVEKAAKELKYDFSGVDVPKNEKDLYGLRYSDFVVPLVKAVQELSAQNDELKKRLENVEQILAQNNTQTNINSNATIVLSAAHLEQNAPNPFKQQTVINYYLPQNSSNAFVKISSINGETIKTISLTAKGNGQLTLQAGQLSSGTYQYTLIVDGRIIDSKKMIITK